MYEIVIGRTEIINHTLAINCLNSVPLVNQPATYAFIKMQLSNCQRHESSLSTRKNCPKSEKV